MSARALGLLEGVGAALVFLVNDEAVACCWGSLVDLASVVDLELFGALTSPSRQLERCMSLARNCS